MAASTDKVRGKYGDGSVYQRKDGNWVAQFNGKYKYAKSEAIANRKLRELKKSPEILFKTEPQKVDLENYFLQWIFTYKKIPLSHPVMIGLSRQLKPILCLHWEICKYLKSHLMIAKNY